jgi:hypothetical protein
MLFCEILFGRSESIGCGIAVSHEYGRRVFLSAMWGPALFIALGVGGRSYLRPDCGLGA